MFARIMMFFAALGLSATLAAQTGHPAKGSWSGELMSGSEATRIRLLIDDHDGEVYQYVGDEIVVTWTVQEGRRHARPVRCFLAIAAALATAEAGLEREFGIAPRVRGALHAGPVISGEVGKTKREIVFHGDVMNTTARLEQLTRDLDRSFIVSAEALARIDERAGYVVEDLGERTVRGRAAPVLVYAVTPAEAVTPA